MRKIISTLLIGAMCTTMLAGCGTKTAEVKEVQTGKSQEDTTQETAEETAAVSTQSTIDWINTTYAMLTAANGGDVKLVGGFEKNDVNKKMVRDALASSWSVTDRGTADDNLEWILTDGHRKSYIEEMNAMKEEGFLDLPEDKLKEKLLSSGYDTAETASCLAVINGYHTMGDHAIDAWDYSRALQLLGWYYVADFYTEQETLDKSLEIAKQLQGIYGSWDELSESYLLGYNYWLTDDPADPNSDTSKRRAVYDKLKSGEDNPYTLDWNTTLEKIW